MREYDLVIRGGTIVDGTGVPRYKADLAVKSGRVAKISGVIKAGAGKEIDASGCIVAPGVLDLHTHYEAQLNWDPYASLSGWFWGHVSHGGAVRLRICTHQAPRP